MRSVEPTEQANRGSQIPGTGVSGKRSYSRRLGPHVTSILRSYGLLIALLIIGLVFEVLTDGLFISSRNIPLLLRQAAIVSIVAMGVALVIVMGHIDLSIGSAVGLCAIVAAFLMKQAEWSVMAAVLAVFAVGIAIGAWHGLAVSVMRVPAFVVTLGGLLIFRGIGLVITEGETLASFPRSFQVFGQGFISPAQSIALLVVGTAVYAVYLLLPALRRRRFGIAIVLRFALVLLGALFLGYSVQGSTGLPVPVAIMGALAIVLGFVASRTRFGRHLYAIGGNRAAAELSGIRVRPTTFGMFVIMGALYALAGVILASRLNGAPPQGAPFLELDAIAAAVIGGTSLMGGVGTVGGALLGALLLTSVSNGLSLMSVPTFYQLIASGLILVLAVFFDVQTKREGM
jgi:D-xylose transport system permease protein